MALIPTSFPDCVVAIGIDVPGDSERRWIASGFLYGDHLGKDPNDESKELYHVYLVTNRHVFQELSRVYLRFNPIANEPAREYILNLRGDDDTVLWVPHPDDSVDVAVISINFPLLREQAVQASYFRSNHDVANVDKLNDLGITEGDFVFVLGYPLGIVGAVRNTVNVRSGSIARIRDALTRDNKDYMIDAFVFPGNSGGPVVSKPEAIAIGGTKSQMAAYLIGIVKAYVPYEDIAYSLQTKPPRPRVSFQENSGLALVHPIDFVQDAIKEYQKTLKPEK